MKKQDDVKNTATLSASSYQSLLSMYLMPFLQVLLRSFLSSLAIGMTPFSPHGHVFYDSLESFYLSHTSYSVVNGSGRFHIALTLLPVIRYAHRLMHSRLFAPDHD